MSACTRSALIASQTDTNPSTAALASTWAPASSAMMRGSRARLASASSSTIVMPIRNWRMAGSVNR